MRLLACPHLLVGFLDVVGHHHRLADPGVMGDLPVHVLASAGVLQARLAEDVRVACPFGSDPRPVDDPFV